MSGLWKGQHTSVDRIAGIQLQTSCEGGGVAIVYGTNRTTGNLLDADDFTAHEVTSSVGKGGGSTSSSWWYSAGIILGICQGPISGINRVWRDNEQAWGLEHYGFTLALGTIPQAPWETWVTKHPGKASAFAGVAYVANADANLGTTGSVKNYSFEVKGLLATEADLAEPDVAIGTGDGETPYFALLDGMGHQLANLQQIRNPEIVVGGVTADPSTYEIRNGWVRTYEEVYNHDGMGPGTRTVTQTVDGGHLYLVFKAGSIPADGAEIKWGHGSWIPYDALPEAVVPDFLSNSDHGALWDEGRIDDLADGPGSFAVYCKAMGFVISPVIRDLKPAADHLQEMLDATNSESVWHAGPSGMVLALVPYGDQPVTANGAEYVPNTTPLYDVGYDDFLGAVDEAGAPTGTDPVQAFRVSPQDVYNTCPVEFNDRTNAYNVTSVDDPEPNDVAQNGLKKDSAIKLACITRHVHAKVISRIRAQRNVNVRTTYKFQLGWRYMLLEPMDIITLSDPLLGISYQAVRIVDIEFPDETGEAGGCTYTAEEWPWGTGHASPGSTLDPNSNLVPNTLAVPGDANPPVIAALPLKFTGGVPRIAIGTSGGPLWGGCQVWVSTDDETYQQAGTISKRARHGYLTAAQGDTGGASVDVSSCGLQLDGVTADQAEALQTATYCDCEVWGWETATLTAAGQYDLGGAIRGAYGTPALPHAQYSPFLVLDDAPLYLDRQADWVGKTLYVKLTSYNIWGRATQDLADVEPYTLTLGTLLALSIVSGSIRVANSDTLGAGTWTLHHQVWRGDVDTMSEEETVALTLVGGAFTHDFANPMTAATHVFWLERVLDGQLTIFQRALLTIQTGGTTEPSNGGGSGDTAYIPNGDSEQGAIAGVGGHGVLDTQGLEATGYGGSRYVRSTKQITAGTNDVISRLIPCEAGDVVAWSYNHRIRDVGYSGSYTLRVLSRFYDVDGVDLGAGTIVGGKNSFLNIGSGPFKIPPDVWPNDWLAGTGQATAPTGAAYCLLRITPDATDTAEFWVDNLVADVVQISSTDLLGMVKVATSSILKLSSAGELSLDEAALPSGTAPAGLSGCQGLRISYPQSSAIATIHLDAITVTQGDGTATTLVNQDVDITLTASGVGGLDAGSPVAGHEYHLWLVYNPTTGALAGLASTSSAAPSCPTGYEAGFRVGCNFAKTTSAWLPGQQVGNVFSAQLGSGQANLPVAASGVLGTMGSAWATVALRGATGKVPTTAGIARLYGTSGGNMIVAPSSAWGLFGASAPPPLFECSNTVGFNLPFDVVLESDNVYAQSNHASSYLYVVGWTDDLALGSGGAGGGATAAGATVTLGAVVASEHHTLTNQATASGVSGAAITSSTGTEVASYTWTPKAVGNKIRIRYTGTVTALATCTAYIGIFLGAAATPAAQGGTALYNGYREILACSHEITASSTDPITIKVRIGQDSSLGGMDGSCTLQIDEWSDSVTALVGPQGAQGPAGGPQGLQGPAGADGKTLRYGTTAPASGLGNDGDFYLNTATNTLYGPKESGAWPEGVTLNSAGGNDIYDSTEHTIKKTFGTAQGYAKVYTLTVANNNPTMAHGLSVTKIKRIYGTFYRNSPAMAVPIPHASNDGYPIGLYCDATNIVTMAIAPFGTGTLEVTIEYIK